MNLRRQKQSDSLDMLLDTMCNAFGGIILLAVLVALLSQQNSDSGNSPESEEMLNRRIEQAELSLKQTQVLLADLTRRAAEPSIQQRVERATERHVLEEKLAAIQFQTEQQKQVQKEEAAIDPSKRLQELNSQLAQAVAARVNASNILATTIKENQRLRDRLADIRRQSSLAQQAVTQKLRLPKERVTGKDVFNVIVQYGKIYPLRNADIDRNTTTIDWEDTATGAIARPKPDRGIDPRLDPAGLAQFFRRLPRGEYYIAFYVFEDSFPSFNVAKQAAVAVGMDFGWMPLELKEAPIQFGAVGTRPKAQ